MSLCKSRKLTITLIILIKLLAFVGAEPYVCSSDAGYTSNSTFDDNLAALLSSLSKNIYGNGTYNSSMMQKEETADALALCRADQTPDQCRSCVQSGASKLFDLCWNKRQGVVWYDACMVRYADDITQNTSGTEYIIYNAVNVTNGEQFREDRARLLEDLRLLAVHGSSELKAGAGKRDTPSASGSQTIYGLVQCNPNLSPEDCKGCLIKAAESIKSCCEFDRGVRMLMPDCNIEYKFYSFYNETRMKELNVHLQPSLGACYGTSGNDLPRPTQVIALYNQYGIGRIRLYEQNPSLLWALKGQQNISVIVGVNNTDIPGFAINASLAKSWIRNIVRNYADVNLRYIVVGNDISPLESATSSIAGSVAPAMQNIYDALSAAGLAKRVKVSTALSMGVLGISNPPSAGAFKPEIRSLFIDPIVKFLVNTRGPFLVNVHPYYAYTSNTNDIRLDYALFTSPSTVVKDGEYEYRSLFDAMVDAVRAALERAGGGDLDVVVSETGWPSEGGTAASVDNARIYNTNLIKSIGKGTPRKPGKPIEAYIYDLFDENQKSSEAAKHWGLFLPNRQPKYPISFN